MDYQHKEDLSPEEKTTLKRLSVKVAPPKGLENQIVAELQQKRLLNSETFFVSVLEFKWLKWAAAAVIFAAGFAFGTQFQTEQASPAIGKQFALLIYEDQVTPKDEITLTMEYVQWIQGIAKSGRFTSGTKFHTTGKVLKSIDNQMAQSPVEDDSHYGNLGGFFLIQANDYEEAVEIASTCPHLSYSGTIEVRELDQR